MLDYCRNGYCEGTLTRQLSESRLSVPNCVKKRQIGQVLSSNNSINHGDLCLIGRVAASLAACRPRRTGLGALHHPAPSLSHSPWARIRPWCEVNKLCGHAHSPLGVGACFPYSLSQTGAPSLPQHYPRSSLLWAPPTSGNRCPLPRCLGLSEGAHCSAPITGSPWLPHNRCVRLDTV